MAKQDERKSQRANSRGECYDQLRACMEQHLRDYYKEHPDRLLDERSMQKVEMMRKSLVCILQILDGYEIQRSEPKG